MNATRLATRVVAALLLSFVACKGKDSPTAPLEPQASHTIRAAAATARVGEPVRLFVTGALSEPVYLGTIGSIAAKFGRTNDSTLTGIIPDMAAGSTTLGVTIGGADLSASVTIVAGATIANPIQSITASLDEMAALSFARPQPVGYIGTWASDSAIVAAAWAKARADAGTLSAASQLLLARLLESRADASTGAPVASRVAAGDACVNALNLWKTAAAAADEDVALTDLNSVVAPFIKAWAVTRFLASYAWSGEAYEACAVPGTYAATAGAIDDAGTPFTVTVVRRSFTEDDKNSSATAQLFYAMWASIHRQAAALASVVNLSIPTSLAPKVVGTPIPVDAQSIALVGGQVQITPTATAPARLTTKDGKLYLVVDETFEQTATVTAAFAFTVTEPANWPTQMRSLPLPVRRCGEDGKWYRACSYRITLTSAGYPATGLPVGEDMSVTSRVFDDQGTELAGRVVRWDPSGSVKTSAPTGASVVVTGVRESETALIFATAGERMSAALKGALAFKVVPPVVDHIDLTVANDEMQYGQTTAVTAKIYNPAGKLLDIIPKWTSSNPGVATVSELTGLVTPVGYGTTTISAAAGKPEKTGTIALELVLLQVALSAPQTSIAGTRTLSGDGTVGTLRCSIPLTGTMTGGGRGTWVSFNWSLSSSVYNDSKQEEMSGSVVAGTAPFTSSFFTTATKNGAAEFAPFTVSYSVTWIDQVTNATHSSGSVPVSCK